MLSQVGVESFYVVINSERGFVTPEMATRYFLVLAGAANLFLFTGTGYFCFSGVFNFADWACDLGEFYCGFCGTETAGEF